VGALQKNFVIAMLYFNLDQLILFHYLNEFFYFPQIAIFVLRHCRILS